MYTNNLEQLINFFYFMIVGMILSVTFDIFRVLRRSFKTSDVVTNIEDVIFGFITGIIILLSIFLLNNGELRFYIFIGIAIGMILYMLFISKFFIKINVAIIRLVKQCMVLFTKPFKILLQFLKKVLFKPISFIVINIKLFMHQLASHFKKSTKIHKKTDKEEGFSQDL